MLLVQFHARTQAFRGRAHRMTRKQLVALDAGTARNMANANVAAQATEMLDAVHDALARHAPGDATAIDAGTRAAGEGGGGAGDVARRGFAWLPELVGLPCAGDGAGGCGEARGGAWPTGADTGTGTSTSATADAIRDHLLSTVGFALRVAPSTVPFVAGGSGADNDVGPGRGVFVRGAVRAGALVGFSPGTVYTSSDLKLLLKAYVAREQQSDDAATQKHGAELYEALVLRNEYFFAEQRLDGVVLDAHPGRNPHPDCLHGNPFALAHMVNHPSTAAAGAPATTSGGQPLLPNVLAFDFDVPSGFSHERLIPNVYHSGSRRLLDRVEPQDTWRCLHSRVLVAMQDLDDGMELLVDYRLNPAADLPPWYAPVDKDADAQRWRDN